MPAYRSVFSLNGFSDFFARSARGRKEVAIECAALRCCFACFCSRRCCAVLLRSLVLLVVLKLLGLVLSLAN